MNIAHSNRSPRSSATQWILWAALAGAITSLPGCAHEPPDPAARPDPVTMHAAGEFDLNQVRATLAELAPELEWDGKQWNRLTLLAGALTTHPDLAYAKAQLAAAQAAARAARIAPGPTFTLSAEYAFDAPESSPWLFGAGSDFLLDRGGRKQARIDEADITARQAALNYLAGAWAVRMRVRRAVDACLAARAQRALADELVVLRQRQFEAIHHRVEAGADSHVELEGSRADLAVALTVTGAIRAAGQAADLGLATATGVGHSAIACADIAPDAQQPGVLAPPSQDDVAAALMERAEILAATADYDRAETSVRAAVASQYPEVHLGPGYTWERGLSKLPFALTLAFPASDLGRSAIAAAEAQRAAAARNLEATVAAVRTGIERAWTEHGAALDALVLIQEQTLPTALTLASEADTSLAAGAIDRAAWAAAQAGLVNTKLEEAAVVNRLRDAEAMLEDALRSPLAGPEQILARKPLVMAEGHDS